MNPKVKTALFAATTVILTAGGVVHMTQFPEPGEVGGAQPTEHSIEERMTAERLEMDVIFMCEDIGRRTSRFSVLDKKYREWIEVQLMSAGFEVEQQGYEVGRKDFYNIVGTKKGKSSDVVLLGTHHDSYGKHPCANACATGVAAVLETARAVGREEHEKTIVVTFFATGEKPHIGRETSGARVWLDKAVEGGMNFEVAMLVGSFGAYRYGDGTQHSNFPWYLLYPSSGEWVGVYGSFMGKGVVQEALHHWGSVSELPARGFAAPTWMPGIPSSDQIPFHEAGVPTVMFTDTGSERDKHLRTSSDIPYTIPYKEMAKRVHALTGVVRQYANSAALP